MVDVLSRVTPSGRCMNSDVEVEPTYVFTRGSERGPPSNVSNGIFLGEKVIAVNRHAFDRGSSEDGSSISGGKTLSGKSTAISGGVLSLAKSATISSSRLTVVGESVITSLSPTGCSPSIQNSREGSAKSSSASLASLSLTSGCGVDSLGVALSCDETMSLLSIAWNDRIKDASSPCPSCNVTR